MNPSPNQEGGHSIHPPNASGILPPIEKSVVSKGAEAVTTVEKELNPVVISGHGAPTETDPITAHEPHGIGRRGKGEHPETGRHGDGMAVPPLRREVLPIAAGKARSADEIPQPVGVHPSPMGPGVAGEKMQPVIGAPVPPVGNVAEEIYDFAHEWRHDKSGDWNDGKYYGAWIALRMIRCVMIRRQQTGKPCVLTEADIETEKIIMMPIWQL